MKKLRQQLLFLYLGGTEPDSQTIAWSLYDGTGKTPPNTDVEEEPPYSSAFTAMKDGWRIIQVPQISRPQPGQEYETDYLKNEYILERMEEIDE